jgi:hypothetical protein
MTKPLSLSEGNYAIICSNRVIDILGRTVRNSSQHPRASTLAEYTGDLIALPGARLSYRVCYDGVFDDCGSRWG